jgi:hypothetical protein
LKLKLLVFSLFAFYGVKVYAQAPPSDLELFDIAKNISNPFANQTQIPLSWTQVNGLGVNQAGSAHSIEFQPVIPVDLGSLVNLTLRPAISLISNSNVNGFSGTGVGGVQLQTYFSPRYRKEDSEYWGIGPYISAPAGTSGNFGSQQTGLGLSGGYVKDIGPWNIGVFLNQSWSVGGNASSGTANFINAAPFVAYVASNGWAYSTYLQPTYNYDAHNTNSVVYANISKTINSDDLPITFSIGPQYNLSPVQGGPHGWGMNFGVNLTMK